MRGRCKLQSKTRRSWSLQLTLLYVHSQFRSNFHISIHKMPCIHTHCGIRGVSGVGIGTNAEACRNENVPSTCTVEAELGCIGGLRTTNRGWAWALLCTQHGEETEMRYGILCVQNHVDTAMPTMQIVTFHNRKFKMQNSRLMLFDSLVSRSYELFCECQFVQIPFVFITQPQPFMRL